jgi:hypothetical protein
MVVPFQRDTLSRFTPRVKKANRAAQLSRKRTRFIKVLLARVMAKERTGRKTGAAKGR